MTSILLWIFGESDHLLERIRRGTAARSARTLKGRYRDPYNARHSSVSWNLMAGKNPLLVAKQHGHGVNTMLEVYAAWFEGARESDVEAIRRAMEAGSSVPSRTRISGRMARNRDRIAGGK